MKQITWQVFDSTVLDACRVVQKLVGDSGGKAHLVGGCVRDLLLGRTPKDIDIEVFGVGPSELKKLLAQQFPLDVVGEAFGVIKLHGLPIDVSLPRRESKRGLGHKGFQIFSDPSLSPQVAASRRDFTVNAMAIDMKSGELLDFSGGQVDLQTKSLTHVSHQFSEDPLRVLRGLQFAGRLGMTAGPDTVHLCKGLKHEYDTLAIERIWSEWYKWAAQSVTPSKGLAFLRECEWIDLYSELSALIGCPQDPEYHPEGDVWMHTLLVVDQAARIAQREDLDFDDRAVLVFSALCHDLGKPRTTEVNNHRVSSHGHTQATDLYEAFLSRIGTPTHVAGRVSVLCQYHLTHIDFVQSSRHVRRVAVALEKSGESLTMLSRLVEADHSGRPPLPAELPPKMAEMLAMAKELSVQETGPRPLLLGRHILQLGMRPGPQVGEILKAAFEAQLEGQFQTEEEAVLWAKSRVALVPNQPY